MSRSTFTAAASLLTGLLSAPAAAQSDSTWRQHDAAADAAGARGDWGAFAYHAERLDVLLSGHPGVVVARARAALQLQDTARALAFLERFAAMGVVRHLAEDSTLAALRGHPRFRAVLEQVRRHGEPLRRGVPAFTVPDSTLVPEDLALDPASGAWYVSSVRHGGVLRRDADGRWTGFVRPGQDTTWATFALALDPGRRRLWVATAAEPQLEWLAPQDTGRTAVVEYHLDTGRLLRRVELPRTGRRHTLGDLTLAGDGTVFVSASRGGEVFRLAPNDTALQVLVPPGELVSPQGIALLPGEQRLLVADYVRGIAVVDRGSGRLEWLPHAPGVALNGIDGLRLDGGRLIAVQNGVQPHRVVILSLSPGLDSITGWTAIESGLAEVVEPTHGLVHQEAYYYIANSGWDALDDAGGWREGSRVTPGVVRRVALH